MAEYHHNTYTPTVDEMREAWVYMQWVETIAGKEIAGAQADNFFAAHDRQVAAKALMDYADALEANRHAESWDKADFVLDVRDWASTVNGEGN